jgi:hypothetical protein
VVAIKIDLVDERHKLDPGVRSRTPKHVAVGAIPELRPPIFAGFFHVRGGRVIDLTENGTSSLYILYI